MKGQDQMLFFHFPFIIVQVLAFRNKLGLRLAHIVCEA